MGGTGSDGKDGGDEGSECAVSEDDDDVGGVCA